MNLSLKFVLSCVASMILINQGMIAQTHTENHLVRNLPNILFLFADDWGRYASIYDEIDQTASPNSVIQTPNFDKVASQGVLFKNAFVPAPSCTPCRSSILSGQYFYRTGLGAILHGAEWDPSIPSYPLILEDHGYHIGYSYKVWSPGTPVNAPYGGERTRYEAFGKNFNRFSQYVSNSSNIEKGKQELFEEVRLNFESFLAEKQPDQPFCYWFGPTNTHRSWIKGSGKDLWGLDPEKLKGKMPDFLPDVPEIREDFNDYLGEVLAWDAAIGVIMETLKKSGEMENTLVVISGDHGIPGFPRGKTNLYDFGTAVALTICWPGKIQGGRVVTDFVNLMDLAPTFLDAANIKIPEVMNGESLIPLLLSSRNGRVIKKRNFVLTGRERHVATARTDSLPYPQRALRTDKYLYIRNFTPNRWPIGTLEKGLRDIDDGPTKNWFIVHHEDPEIQKYWDLAFGKRPYEELYEIKTDLNQMINLAGKKEYHDTKNSLAKKMDSILIHTGDPRICQFDKLPFTKVNEENIIRQKQVEKQVEELIGK